LRPEQVDRLHKRGIFTVAWFADDPVLYAAHTARVAPHYDLTLHTASAATLCLYEARLGVRGLAFPFWTDDISFPRLYDPRRCDLDLVFIGNTQTRVKRWRYDVIAGLPLSRAIYGLVAADPAGIHAGVAPDEAGLARAAVRGRLGLNISQRFSDYAGIRLDFPGLAELGEYPLPSRVVQLGALGVPTISLVGSERAAELTSMLYPPVITAYDPEQVTDVVKLMRDDLDTLNALSDQMHAWYAIHYTAAARARFLEQLVTAPSKWTGLPADRRATAFLQPPTRPGVIDHLLMQRNRATRAVRKAVGRARRGATQR
jgi:hypothetical protein